MSEAGTAAEPILWPVRPQDVERGLDAARTALAFTREFLGFTGIDLVTGQDGDAQECVVEVGLRTESGRGLAVAGLRLARLPDRPGSGWVVQGSAEPDGALELPTRVPALGGVLPVGGQITGVDEALRVAMIDADGRVVAQRGPVALGGVDQDWRVELSYAPVPVGTVLTVVVSTGGHIGDVEWFRVFGAVAG